MARLPNPGQDTDVWGSVLNDFLLQEHRADGQHGAIHPTDLIVAQSPWVDVRALGARGDGTTDDTTAIQAALDTRGNVFIPNTGLPYVIGETLRYHSDQQIFSSGATLQNATTRSSPKTMLAPNSPSQRNIVIKGLRFDQRGDIYGNDRHSYCVSINQAINALIESCVFENICTMAIWSDSDDITQNVRIINNTILSSEAGGFSFFGFIDGIVIANNTIYNCKDDAIALQYVRGNYPTSVSIVGNVIRNCHTQGINGSTPHGILVFGVPNTSVVGNTVNGTFSDSILVQMPFALDQTHVSVCGNICVAAGTNNTGSTTPACGIRVFSSAHHCSHVIIQGNSIHAPRGYGISIVNGKNISVAANTIKSSGSAGIDLTDCENCIVADNIIEEAGHRGINSSSIYLINGCTRNQIVGNRGYGPSNTDRGLIFHADSTQNIARNNIFYDVQNPAILDYGSQNTCLGNVLHNGFPLCRDVILTVGNTVHNINDISALEGVPVHIQALNPEAQVLLAGGYRVVTAYESVSLTTSQPAQGSERILVAVM